MHERNPDMFGARKRYTMQPPQLAREGTKKTGGCNTYIYVYVYVHVRCNGCVCMYLYPCVCTSKFAV